MSVETRRQRRAAPGERRAIATQTSVDRRTCQRVVPMKVLGLGVSRTGTAALREALLDLGYEDCYHISSLLNENPPDANMWIEAFAAKFHGKGTVFSRTDWDQLLGHCMAVTDTPCVLFYMELLEAYPEAKVILGMRDSPEQWWESQMNTIIPFMAKLCHPPLGLTGRLYRHFMPPASPVTRLNDLIANEGEMFRILREDRRNGTKNGIQWYKDYCTEVQRIVPKGNLLVFNNKDGWKPLCRFLGKPEPGWEFPQMNTTKEFNKNQEPLYAFVDQYVYNNVAKTAGAAIIAMLAMGLAFVWQRL